MKALIFLSASVCGPQTTRLHFRFGHILEGEEGMFTLQKIVGFSILEQGINNSTFFKIRLR